MKANKLARTIPLVLLAIMGYVSWIMVRPVATGYFFETDRRGSGIAILVIYFSLFTLEVTSYVRLLYTVASDPAYLERVTPQPSAKILHYLPTRRGKDRDQTKGIFSYHTSLHRLIPLGHAWPAPRLEDFLAKDVFMCDDRGMPKWCSTCEIWRPDRARHVREVDRCVLKADHVCFWVGGVVSEHDMKFFIQFNFYTTVYALFDLVVAAACIGQARYRSAAVNGHWIAMLVLGIFFMMLTLGITISMVWNTVVGLSTPENVGAQNEVEWRVAVRVPNGASVKPHVKTVTFPDIAGATHDELSEYLRPDTPRHGPTYAILTTKPRTNPWDQGWFRNFRHIMGDWPWDWILPLRRTKWLSVYTYCAAQRQRSSHRKGEIRALGKDSTSASFFPTGVDLEAAKAEAGLRSPLTDEERNVHEFRLARRHAIPYLLGGAGAPKKQWAAFTRLMRSRRKSPRELEQG